VALYAGHWKAAFRSAVREAKAHYRTVPVKDKDIVISNNYAKASESMIGLVGAIPLLSPQGGDIVVIANAPEGQVPHYLAGSFGKTSFAVQHEACKIPEHVNRVIIFNEYPHPGSSWFEEHDKIIYRSQWSEVMAILKRTHGPGSRLAVIADCTNQYFSYA